MWRKNKGTEDADILQNQFTKYLITAVGRHKVRYLKTKEKRRNVEIPLEVQDSQTIFQIEPDMLEDLPLLEKLENERLQAAIREMKEQERYIFLARALDEREFAELAAELGLGYKGVAAIYYRAVKKIRSRIEEVEKE